MKALRARVTRRAFGLGAIASVAVPAAARAAHPGAAAVKQRVLTLQPALEEICQGDGRLACSRGRSWESSQAGTSSSPKAMASASESQGRSNIPVLRSFGTASENNHRELRPAG